MIEFMNSPLGKALLILPFVILGNTIFGAVLSDFKDSFNTKILKAGLIKGAVVYTGILAFCLVSFLSNDLKIDFNGASYTLIDAMYVIIWAAVIAYGKDGISKLAQIFSFSVSKLGGDES